MKRSSRFREFAPIAIGLLGMGGYQVALRLPHFAVIEGDLVHGLWFGICLGLELIGLYLLVKNRTPTR